MSKKYQLNKEDYRRILRQVAIIYGPVFLLFLEQLQNGNFDTKVLYALGISITIDTIRRYFNDYTK